MNIVIVLIGSVFVMLLVYYLFLLLRGEEK